jgi:hypothetical protein
MYPFIFSISYIVLSALSIGLFLVSVLTAWHQGHFILALIKAIISLFLVYEIYNEWHLFLLGKIKSRVIVLSNSAAAKNLIYLALGSLSTYFLHVYLPFHPVLASSIIGYMGSKFFRKHQVVIYCGSFVGMASSEAMGGFFPLLLATLIAVVLFNLSKDVFVGFGGKLGAIAFAGTLCSAYIFNTISHSPDFFSLNSQLLTIFYFSLSAFLTFILHKNGGRTSVESSAIIGIALSLLLPIIHVQNASTLMISGFCGSFVGMSTLEKLKKKRYVLLAALLGSFVFIYTQTMFLGLGGKLGAIAFGASIATTGVCNAFCSSSSIYHKYITKA